MVNAGFTIPATGDSALSPTGTLPRPGLTGKDYRQQRLQPCNAFAKGALLPPRSAFGSSDDLAVVAELVDAQR